MNKIDILQRVVNYYNALADIMVKGDGAISMGRVLEDMRALVSQINDDVKTEAAEPNE